MVSKFASVFCIAGRRRCKQRMFYKSTSKKTKKLAWISAGLMAAAIAKDYAFLIAAAGPAYATTTFAADAAAEFNGANQVARLFLQYKTPLALLMAGNDSVYIEYYDGQIGKFKVISPTDTIRLRFDGQVSAVPGSATRPNTQAPGGIGYDQLYWNRTDWLDINNSWFEEQQFRGAVTVGPLLIESYGGGSSGSCSGCHYY